MADNDKPITGSENSKQAADQLREELKAMKKKLRQQVFRALTILEAEILQNIRKNSGLHVRTGALLNSVGSTKKVIEEKDGEITGQIGTQGIPYARIHEFGGTVKPVNKQFLAIPTDENRRADGSPEVSTARLMVLQKLGLSFIHNGVIFMKILGNKQPKPMFILRKSVNIPARPYIRPALAAKQEQIMREFGIMIHAAFESKE
jgi:phage gpG-like protein